MTPTQVVCEGREADQVRRRARITAGPPSLAKSLTRRCPDLASKSRTFKEAGAGPPHRESDSARGFRAGVGGVSQGGARSFSGSARGVAKAGAPSGRRSVYGITYWRKGRDWRGIDFSGIKQGNLSKGGKFRDSGRGERAELQWELGGTQQRRKAGLGHRKCLRGVCLGKRLPGMLSWASTWRLLCRGLEHSRASFSRVPVAPSSSGRGGAEPRSVKGARWEAVLQPSSSGPAPTAPPSPLGPASSQTSSPDDSECTPILALSSRPVPLSYKLLDGEAARPALVFLHGLFGCKNNFNSIAKALAQQTGRRVSFRERRSPAGGRATPPAPLPFLQGPG